MDGGVYVGVRGTLQQDTKVKTTHLSSNNAMCRGRIQHRGSRQEVLV